MKKYQANWVMLKRASKLTGIPTDQLNPKIVEMVFGREKDLGKTYRDLHKFYELATIAKRANVSFQKMKDVLNAIENGDSVDNLLNKFCER